MFIRNSNLTGCPVFNLLNLTTLGRALKKKKTIWFTNAQTLSVIKNKNSKAE